MHAVSIAPPWVGALLTAMRVPTKNAVQVKKVIEASSIGLDRIGLDRTGLDQIGLDWCASVVSMADGKQGSGADLSRPKIHTMYCVVSV